MANDAPEYFGRSQVGTISTPALSQSEVGGVGHITNSAGRSRPRKGRVPGMGSVSPIASPLRLSSVGEILGAAKLGQRPPAEKTAGEHMSDADGPTQAVKSAPDGTGFVHHRRMSNGTVNSNPIGAGRNPLDDYEHLNYDPMPANVGELQQRLGIATKSLFGNEA